MAACKKSSPLNSKSKEIVGNVLEYFKSEADIQRPQNRLRHSFIGQTADATGVSERTVHRIQKEKQLSSTGQLQSPKKSKKTDYKCIDDFDRVAIRNKIIEFYTVRRQLPTVRNLLDTLKADISFPGSRHLLRKVVGQLGFRWKKTKSNRSVLVEKESVVKLRLKYYQKKEEFEKAGFEFVYIDETWIDSSHTSPYCWQGPGTEAVRIPVSKGQRLIIVHGGSRRGFVPGALLVYKAASATGDYHQEMNGENFMKWMREKLLPNITERSVIVLDNASYHCVQSDKCPSSNTRKAEIQRWLTEHGIEYNDRMLRPKLLEIAKRHKPEPSYKIDALVQQFGHKILRLPPYHPDLNPIELIWSQVKHIVASRNVTHRLSDIMTLTIDAFTEIDAGRWERACKHARDCEAKYKAGDMVVDTVVDEFIIDLRPDSDDSTDSASEAEDFL